MHGEKKYSVFIGLILIAVATALIKPELFVGFKPFIPSLLGIIMFGIGLTLDSNDFKQVYTLKWQVICLVIFKSCALPLVAFGLVKIFNLPNEDLIGLLMVSAAPGGTAAAVMSFLARANVALTVVLTLITTILAPIIMPAIVYLFLHKYIVIPVYDMASSIFWIVLFPMFDGLIIRRVVGENRIQKIRGLIPWVSILSVALIIACIVSLNHKRILTMSSNILIVVLLDNLLGIMIGYLLARKVFKMDAKSAQAVSFEFGIQDSGLAVVLATKFFGVATALCGAIYSIIQNLTGPITVKIFSRESK